MLHKADAFIASASAPPVRASNSGLALGILAVFAIVIALYVARAFVVPLLIGILTSYALYPVVDWLTVRRIPRPISAALVLLLLSGGLSWVGYSLSDDVAVMIEKLPEAARRLHERINDGSSSSPTPLQNVQEAARELEKAAATAAGEKVPARTAEVVPTPAHGLVREFLLAQSAVLVGVAAKVPFILLLAYFLLASGHHFRHKAMQIFGQSRSEKRRVLALLEEIELQVQRYMLVMLITNVLIAACTWLVFESFGMENAGVWGVAAGVLHFIPYIGTSLIAISSAIAAFLQFGSIVHAAVISSVSSLIAGGIGMVFMTWLQSRFASVNAAMLFIALLFFGWLWGVWGLLLGAPLVAIAKVICDRIEFLKPAGELLGR